MSDVLGRWVSVRDGLEIHSKRHAAALVKAGDALAARVVELEGEHERRKSAEAQTARLHTDLQFYKKRRGELVIERDAAEQRAAAFQRALEVAEQWLRDLREEAEPKDGDPPGVAGVRKWATNAVAAITAAKPRPCTWQRLAQDQQVLEDCPEMALPGSAFCAKHQGRDG